MPELQRLCPLCLTADQHAPGCFLEGKEPVHIPGDIDHAVDWPATLEKYGLKVPRPAMALEIIGEIASMSLKPGDVVAVKIITGTVSPEALERIHASVQPHFPNNDVLVTNGDVELSIFRKGEAADD